MLSAADGGAAAVFVVAIAAGDADVAAVQLQQRPRVPILGMRSTWRVRSKSRGLTFD